MAGADEETSAIFETAACSDRRLCEDCLVLTPTTLFNENHPYDEDPSYKLVNQKRKNHLPTEMSEQEPWSAHDLLRRFLERH